MTATDPYTVRIIVKEDDPEFIRIIDRMNWTGQVMEFPREQWVDARRTGPIATRVVAPMFQTLRS